MVISVRQYNTRHCSTIVFIEHTMNVESGGDVKSVLNMAEYDKPPSLEEDEEITMSGFSEPVNASL